MRLEISIENSFYVANFRGENSLYCIVHSSQKDLVELWLVTTLCNTPMKFPATIPVSARPVLFATMATLSILIVSMRLGSFMYSTFDSHHGKSFKLF